MHGRRDAGGGELETRRNWANLASRNLYSAPPLLSGGTGTKLLLQALADTVQLFIYLHLNRHSAHFFFFISPSSHFFPIKHRWIPSPFQRPVRQLLPGMVGIIVCIFSQSTAPFSHCDLEEVTLQHFQWQLAREHELRRNG